MEIPVDTLTATELVAGIEEIKHQIVHLKRSQVELKEFIIGDPDPEFVQAVEENEEVLTRKNASLMMFIEALRLLDATTAAHYQSSLVEQAAQGENGDDEVVARGSLQEGDDIADCGSDTTSVPTQGVFL